MWLHKKIIKIIWEELVRFIIVWGISTIINYSFFYIWYNYLKINYLISSWIWYILWVIVWYFLNKLRTFKNKSGHQIKTIIKYCWVYAFSWLSWIWLLYVLVNFLKMNPEIGNILSVFWIVGINYIWTKYLVFYKKTNDGF